MEVRLRIPIPPKRGGGEAIRALLEVLIRAWLPTYQAFPLPLLYESGIRYQPEPNRGEYEDFRSPQETFAAGWGDCDDLVVYRCVELQARGELARPQWVRLIGTGRMHVRVRRGDSSVEDPSLILLRKFGP